MAIVEQIEKDDERYGFLYKRGVVSRLQGYENGETIPNYRDKYDRYEWPYTAGFHMWLAKSVTGSKMNNDYKETFYIIHND